MRPRYIYQCPFCRGNFTAIPPSTISCPHCNSILMVDYNQVTLIRPGIQPTPAGAPTIGGGAVGAIIGGLVAGVAGAVIGGIIGLLIGSAAGQRERQE